MHELEEIEERIGETDVKKIKERRRIIAKDNSGNKWDSKKEGREEEGREEEGRGSDFW